MAARRRPGIAGLELLRAVAELVRERDRLARRVEVLDAKLIEVTDLLENGDAARAAYRRGYYAGHKAKSRGRPARVAPEQHATGVDVAEVA